MSDPILNPGTCVSCGKEGGYIMWCEECIRGGNAEKQVVSFVANLFDPKQMAREIRDLLGTVKEQEQKIEGLEEDNKRLRAEAEEWIKAHSQLATGLKNTNLQIRVLVELCRKSKENFDDDLEERPMRHSLGNLHRRLEVALENHQSNDSCRVGLVEGGLCGKPEPCPTHKKL